MSAITNCPSCGSYVSPGASDCAKCGFLFGTAEEDAKEDLGPLLSGLLMLSVVGTIWSLVVYVMTLWKMWQQATLLGFGFFGLTMGALAMRLWAVWSVWHHQREGVYWFFGLGILLLIADAIFAEWWRVITPAAILIAMALMVRKKWHLFS